MPRTISRDEVPGTLTSEPPINDGKVECPECGNRLTPGGLQRHITVAHRGGVPDPKPSTTTQKAKVDIASRWIQFQNGAAMLVSLACTQCAQVLASDAEKDAIALAEFCANRPKVRKQVEDLLTGSDFMILLAAFGGTARDMIKHHSIGQRLPIATVGDHGSNGHQSAEQRMAAFMMSMPPAQRNAIIDQAFSAAAKGQQRQREYQQPQSSSMPQTTMPTPGAEPTPIRKIVDEQDARQVRAAHSNNSPFMASTIGDPPITQDEDINGTNTE